MFNLVVEPHVDKISQPVTVDVAGRDDLLFQK